MSELLPDPSETTGELPCDIVIEVDSAFEICLRPLHKSDQERIERGIREMSDRSRQMRFFSSFKTAPRSVIEQLTSMDGVNHIAWGAVDMTTEGHPAIAAARVIRSSDNPEKGEFAVGVLDAYHGKGIARLLAAALFIDCVAQGIREVDIVVLRENSRAAGLVTTLQAKPTHSESGVRYYHLDLESALNTLRNDDSLPGLRKIFKALEV